MSGLRVGSWSLVAALFVAGLSTAAVAAPHHHYGDALVRVHAWPDDVVSLGLDVWTHEPAGPNVVARVTLQQRALLDASGYEYVVIDPDLGPRVEAERARLLAAPPVPGGLDPSFHQDYRSFEAVLARLAGLVAAQPQRVSHVDVGLSLEGRMIRGVRITNPGPADRPVVLVQGGQHAREWIAVAASVFAAEQFATAVGGGYLDGLLDEVELVIVPVVNPDGYAYSWDVDRYWRKNRRDDLGVDLNRNWSVAWGGEGASPDPLAENYHGAAPFSEPESAAMRDLVAADPNMIAFLDLHSYGQLLLYPWGFGAVEAPDDALLADLAADMADAMWQPHQRWYAPLQSADLYPAAGNAHDWTYGVHGLYSITLELRPASDEEGGFVLPPQAIVPTGDEVVIAIAELIEASVALGPGEPGGSDGGAEAGEDSSTGESTSTSTSSGPLDGSSGAVTSGGLESSAGAGPADDSGDAPLGTGGGASEGSGGDPSQQGEDGGGCGCRQGERGRGATWWAAALLGLVLARRRRSALVGREA